MQTLKTPEDYAAVRLMDIAEQCARLTTAGDLDTAGFLLLEGFEFAAACDAEGSLTFAPQD